MSLTPIEEGIKKIGVGKKTSKVCDKDLTDRIIDQLKDDCTDDTQKATFLAALKVKGAEGEELRIAEMFGESFTNNRQFVLSVAPDTSAEVLQLVTQLLEGKTFDVRTAKTLGEHLFSEDITTPLKALIAVILRMRYTTLDEYDGILQAITSTFNSSFTGEVQTASPIVQISEPFDGHKRGYLLAPLYAHFLKTKGFTPLLNSGNSSGPKFGITPLCLKEPLNITELSCLDDINSNSSTFGHILEQEKLSDTLTDWQSIRIKMLKRPFLATLEKYVNPYKADMLICSSFHDTFYDKGVDLAKRAGFNKCINIIRGLEGSCGLSLKRKSKATMFVKKGDEYIESEFEFQPEDFGIESINDMIVKDLTTEQNAQLITDYIENDNNSADNYFNLRAQYSLKVLDFLISKAYDVGDI